jgi:hypothetical protein
MRIVRILTATVFSVCLATSALAQAASPASKLSVSGAKARQGATLNKPGKALGLDAPTPILIAMVVGAALYFALHKSDPKSP